MAKKDSSSKRKSSKHKTSKITSQKKKESKRNKSKKSRHAELAVSSYSDDESRSLLSRSSSDYSSSSEDDHKTRKGRSRAPREVKSKRKKVRRRSSSLESNPKKRKRSKKDVKLGSRKKSRKGKRRRDVSLSSESESQSSSRRGLHGNSSEEREPRKKRGRSRESKKHRRDRSKVEIKTGNSRSKSPSCSYGIDDHHTNSLRHGEEEIATEYRPRRLRSVITVVKRQEEDASEKNRYEEEMLYDHYDYPSSRSNDSNDGVRLDKTEAGRNETEDLAEYDITDRATHEGDPLPFYNTHEAEIEHGDISSVVSEPTQDLELLLRQKALENLRKFRVEKQNNLKSKVSVEGQSDTISIQSSVVKTRNVHEEPKKLNRMHEQDPAKNSYNTPSETNTSPRVIVDCESSYGENTREEPVRTNNQTSSEISDKEKKNISTLDVNVKLGSATPSPIVLLGVSSSTGNELEVSETPSLEIATEQQDQSKDGSQYEKKTMSVMRGGEMVQVSYKVYIPKKTPALHRRQLRR